MNLYVIIGEDGYLVDEAAKKAAGAASAALEVVDSANSGNAELQLRDIAAADASFSTPPFLEPSKATWWRNVHFLPHAGAGAPSRDVKEALEKLARKLADSPLPDNQRFVLSGPRLLQSSVFAKTLKGAAEMIVFQTGNPKDRVREAEMRTAEFCAEMGLSVDPQTAALFVSRVGADTRSVRRELEKMRDYLGGRGKVTAAAIEDVTSQGVGVEPELWAVTDAVGERRGGRAVAAARLFEGDGFAVMMTSVLEKHFRQLAAIKDAQARGRLGEATAGMKPFAVQKTLSALGKWTLQELRAAHARFMDLRERAVSSADGIDELVMAAIARVCISGGAR